MCLSTVHARTRPLLDEEVEDGLEDLIEEGAQVMDIEEEEEEDEEGEDEDKQAGCEESVAV